MCLSRSTRGDFDHSSLHVNLRPVLKCCFAADLLYFRGFLRAFGKVFW